MVAGDNIVLVTELIKGAELLKVIQNRVSIDVPFNPHLIIAQLIMTLEYLHNQNIVYRDIKAENIMLDENGNVKLIDFGLSSYKPYRNAKLSSKIGTPLFFAPEMIMGRKYDEAIDWYGLGLLMYEVLTKRIPFEGYRKSNLVRVITRGFDCPDSLDSKACDLIQKLAHRNPEKRLGIKNIREIKGHPWLSGIDWSSLNQQVWEYQRSN